MDAGKRLIFRTLLTVPRKFLRSEGYNVGGGSQIAATMLELYHDKVIISNKAGPAGRPESKTKVKGNKSRTVKSKSSRK